jgi:hypothetical protein
MGRQRELKQEPAGADVYAPRSGPERIVLVGIERSAREKTPGVAVQFVTDES